MRRDWRALLVLLLLAAFVVYTRHRGPREVPRTLALEEGQCAAAFPGLEVEIERAVKQGPFVLKRHRDDLPGSVQGRIKDGKVYIISATEDNVLRRTPAILHSLHRAVITSPTPLPDTVFSININDVPRANSWSFVRSDDDFSPHTPWLMPHFSSWSWPLPYVGPLDEALTRIEELEEHVRWEDKADVAIWRGTAWFNPEWSVGLRPKLVEITKEKEWADVQVWGQGQDPKNTLSIDEFCRYRYIIYAEGKSYSGRLPYHQACASIILTPPPTFLLHTTHLMRPLFSSVLLSGASHTKPTAPPASSYPIPATATTWPLSYPAHQANVIFVQPDWSDLEATIAYLRQHPDMGADIARRQREAMVGGGYLGEAAETCYWRALIRAWSRMAQVEGEWEEGMRWETFSLVGKVKFA